jgi:hypothetical protein
MAQNRICRVVVLDGDLQPVGMLSVVDIAMQANDPRSVAEVLARVAHSSAPPDRSPMP